MARTSIWQTTKSLLQGKPFMSHPVHPVLVHFPMTLVPVSFIFDLMASRGDKSKALSQAGYYANMFGVVSALPTAITGVAEWIDIPRDHPSWVTATTHAALNDVVLAISLYNWWSRRDRTQFRADQTNLVLSGVATAVLGVSGWLGGLLVYDHGLGVQRQGSALEAKHENAVWELTHAASKPASEEAEARPYGTVAVPEAGHEQALGADI